MGLTVSCTGEATVAGTLMSGRGGVTVGATAMTPAPTRATPAVAYGRMDESINDSFQPFADVGQPGTYRRVIRLRKRLAKNLRSPSREHRFVRCPVGRRVWAYETIDQGAM